MPEWVQLTALVLCLLQLSRTLTDAAGSSTHLSYDGLNKTGRIDALGQSTSFFYDARNRPRRVTYVTTVPAINSERDYGYDYAGNLLAVTEPTKTAAGSRSSL